MLSFGIDVLQRLRSDLILHSLVFVWFVNTEFLRYFLVILGGLAKPKAEVCELPIEIFNSLVFSLLNKLFLFLQILNFELVLLNEML